MADADPGLGLTDGLSALPVELLDRIAVRLTPLDYANLRECSRGVRDAVDRAGTPVCWRARLRGAYDQTQGQQWEYRRRADQRWEDRRRADIRRAAADRRGLYDQRLAALLDRPDLLLGASLLRPVQVSACLLTAMSRYPGFVSYFNRCLEYFVGVDWLDDLDSLDKLAARMRSVFSRRLRTSYDPVWGWVVQHMRVAYWVPRASFHFKRGFSWRLLAAMARRMKWLADDAALVRHIVITEDRDDNCDDDARCLDYMPPYHRVFPQISTIAIDYCPTWNSYDTIVLEAPVDVAEIRLRGHVPDGITGHSIYVGYYRSRDGAPSSARDGAPSSARVDSQVGDSAPYTLRVDCNVGYLSITSVALTSRGWCITLEDCRSFRSLERWHWVARQN